MEHTIKQLKNGAKNTRLSVAEKAVIKSQLLHYVKSHPVGSGAFSSHVIPSPFSIQNFRNKKTLSAFVVGGLLIGGTVSFAAENTIPGDVLYPIKIHVNESIFGAVAVTPQAKADWGVRKAERRLEEVEKLAVAPTVSPEIRANAEASFNASADQVQEHITNFEKQNDSEDAIRTAGKLANMLRTHEHSLDGKRNFREMETKSLEQTNATNSSASDASTTVAVPVSRDESKAFIDVLDNVRGVRGNAEKRQKELKHKYHKDESVADVPVSSDAIVEPQIASPDVGPAPQQKDEIYNESFGKKSRARNEEIHTAPIKTGSEATEIPKPAQTNEAPKINEND